MRSYAKELHKFAIVVAIVGARDFDNILVRVIFKLALIFEDTFNTKTIFFNVTLSILPVADIGILSLYKMVRGI